MKVHRWNTITAFIAAAALTIGAAPSQASTLVESTNMSASELSKLPLTDRHLTKHEKANLAVVLRAYHAGEGNILDAQGFMDLFAHDGVLNGIGGVEVQTPLRGEQLGGLIVWTGTLLPDRRLLAPAQRQGRGVRLPHRLHHLVRATRHPAGLRLGRHGVRAPPISHRNQVTAAHLAGR
jgi:hypothetical protein